MTNPQAIRQAILAAPFELDNTGETPKPGTLFIPLAHRKALSRDAILVIGARGVGKSFWAAALSDELLRGQIGESVNELARTNIYVGHAAKPSISNYPDRDVFSRLIKAGNDSYSVWRAVVVRWLAGVAGEQIPVDSWSSTVAWVDQNPERFAQIAERANELYVHENKSGLIIFDALDRTSHDWGNMNHIVRTLLQVALWLRDFSNLRAKLFLRPDQLERSVTSFVDASKILATRAELTWDRHDLHAMMWQRLVNAPSHHGEVLRNLLRTVLPSSETLSNESGAWIVPKVLGSEAPYQRPLFEALAGDKMGKDARRGVPYVWSVSHLADGHGWTSPRSFLAAISGAAEDSERRYASHLLALHYESIKRGIQKASQIRVEQVTEDDPWVPEVMSSLSGMNVPCEYTSIQQKWQQEFPAGPSSITNTNLPPQHAENWDGVRKDLERLGILVTRKDGRVDMPDLYRVGFSLGRKGGVAPKK